MRLHEYKTRALTLLLNYQPKSEREKELIERLVIKINQLRAMTLPRLLMDVHLIISHEPVSQEFKELLKKLIPSESEVEELLKE